MCLIMRRHGCQKGKKAKRTSNVSLKWRAVMRRHRCQKRPNMKMTIIASNSYCDLRTRPWTLQGGERANGCARAGTVKKENLSFWNTGM